MTAVPAAVIDELLTLAIRSADMERGVLEAEFAKKLRQWDAEKVSEMDL